MPTLEEWEFKATGNLNTNEIFLLGTRHLLRDIPIVEEAFALFKPTFVLIETTEESAKKKKVAIELARAIQICEQSKIEMGYFDVDYVPFFNRIKQKCSLIDSFAMFFLYQMTTQLSDPSLDSAKRLISAIKADSPNLSIFVENWMLHMAIIFVHLTTREKNRRKQLAQILSNAGYRNYLEYLKKNIKDIYSATISRKEVREVPYGTFESTRRFEQSTKNSLVSMGFSPNYEKARRIWIDERNEKMFKRVQKYFQRRNQRILIITGYAHFQYFKERLNLQ